MQQLAKRYFALNIWVKIIFFFCLFGAFVNFFLLGRDIFAHGVLWRLHSGFFLLYISQAVFILLQERYVCILTVLQGVLALWTNADFTFVPLLRLLGNFYYLVNPVPSVESLKTYAYVSASAAFTLQMLSAYALFSLLPRYESKQKEQTADLEN